MSDTFKEWLETHDPDFDWQVEYSGNVKHLEMAWNAGVQAAIDRLASGNDFEGLKSNGEYKEQPHAQ